MLRVRPALRVASIYLLFGLAWILGSDVLVGRALGVPPGATAAQLLKGSLFVIASAALILLLVRRERRRWLETEGQLAATFESLLDGVLLLELPERRILACNRAAAAMLGYAPEALIGRSTRLLHVDDESWRQFDEQGMEAIARDGVYRTRSRLRRADGSLFPTEHTVRPIGDRRPPARLVSVVRDISERVLAEEARDKLLDILEATSDFVSTADTGGWITYLNRAARRALGLPEEGEAGGLTIGDFHPDWAALRILNEGIPTAMEAGTWQGETALRSASGEEIPISQVIMAHRDAAGGITHLSTVARDIRDLKRAERQLEESRRLFLAAFEATPLPSTISRLQDGRIVRANRAFLETFGIQRSEVTGRPGAELGIWETPAAREAFVRRVREEGAARGVEARMRTRSGEPRDVILFAEPLGLADDLLIIMAVDVTERRRIEQQLLQAQKMEAVGRLAGGVAHDFNNILTGIRGFAELARDALPAGSAVRDDLAEVVSSAERGAALVRQLLAFSRDDVVQPRVLDLNRELEASARMLGRLMGEDVEVVMALDPGAGHVRLDPVQLEQLVMNLAVNARDAMPTGGRLTLRTAGVDLAPAAAGLAGDLPAGRYVSLEVEDTGVGLDARTAERIFEPFFTTKPEGEGTGLGLSTVYAILRRAGGHISVDSAPGEGARFRLLLPRVEGPADEVEPSVGRPPPGTGTVLVVEDDDAVRRLIERTLRDAGYAVLAAVDGGRGLALADEHPGPIHLAITDVVMPGIHGGELAERLERSRPGLPILFITGYTEDAAVRRGVSAGEVLLRKPFTPPELLRTVRRMLEAEGDRSGRPRV